MQTNTSSSGSADCRHTVLQHVSGCDSQLAPLVRRIADNDRDGIVGLHAVLWARAVGDLHAILPDLADAEAVATATFLEIWLLARFHTDPGADVCVWIDGILVRRAAERVQTVNAQPVHDGRSPCFTWAGPSWTALAQEYDRLTARALASVLSRDGGADMRTAVDDEFQCCP